MTAETPAETIARLQAEVAELRLLVDTGVQFVDDDRVVGAGNPVVTLKTQVDVYVYVDLDAQRIDRVVVDDDSMRPYTDDGSAQFATAVALADDCEWPHWQFGW